MRYTSIRNLPRPPTLECHFSCHYTTLIFVRRSITICQSIIGPNQLSLQIIGNLVLRRRVLLEHTSFFSVRISNTHKQPLLISYIPAIYPYFNNRKGIFSYPENTMALRKVTFIIPWIPNISLLYTLVKKWSRVTHLLDEETW